MGLMPEGYISRVSVDINRGEVGALFARRGALGRWLHRTMGRISGTAKIFAPGAGTMKGQHYYRSRRTSTFVAKGTVGNRSRHAWFVHEGTAAHHRGVVRSRRIYPTRARALRTPWGPKASVAGQEANPWLQRAARVVLHRYGVRI